MGNVIGGVDLRHISFPPSFYGVVGIKTLPIRGMSCLISYLGVVGVSLMHYFIFFAFIQSDPASIFIYVT